MGGKNKMSFDYGLRAYKEKYFTIHVTVRLDPAQKKFINETLKRYPGSYSSRSDVIRAALNYFIRHQKNKIEV